MHDTREQALGSRGHDPKRVLLLGATGTIGRATAHALTGAGHDVVCFARANSQTRLERQPELQAVPRANVEFRYGNIAEPYSLSRDGIRGERFDALVSCLASRTGAPRDAWDIDYKAHAAALADAKAAGITHMVLLSAICVQKPMLAFQHAKIAFEKVLMSSGVGYSIVRPTAFFKSLSGQVERVKQGKPFLLFGDGTATACKPISDADLAEYITRCIDDPDHRNRILPIGGPGPAITPREQGEQLFKLLGRPAKFRHVPLSLLDGIIATLDGAGRIIPALRDKAELARIGRYYATESMLVLDPATGRYDAAATPSTGTRTLFEFYDQLLRGDANAALGAHKVF